MPAGDDDPLSDRRIQHFETIHRVAADALRRQVDSFHTIEQKVWRHTALLGVILGAFAVSSPRAFKTLNEATGLASCVFELAYFGTLLFSALGLLCFVMAVKYDVLWEHPISENESFVDAQGRKESYARSLVSLARGAEEAFRENRPMLEAKASWANLGWWSLPIVLFLGSVALGSFACLKL